MLVCIDKVTCVRMHGLIQKHWAKRIEVLQAEPVSGQDALQRGEQLRWMAETRMAVVVSEEQGEVDKFRQWGQDIIPHRRLMKEGIELPEAMRGLPQFRNMQSMELEQAFKEPRHPLRVSIVCAMWLTGFDVPSLATLYLDKPLKAHTLMQAIARANRVHQGKNNGLIVDYCGILKHLREALATFAGIHGDGSQGGQDPARPDAELLADLGEAIAFVRAFLDQRDAPLDAVIETSGFDRNAAIGACKEAANDNDESRKRFELMCREVFKKFKACINVDGVNAHRADRDAINIVYKALQRDRDQADIGTIIRQLHQLVDDAIETNEVDKGAEPRPYDISAIDFDRLRQEFERSPRKNSTVQNLRQAIEQRLQRMLMQNPLPTDFQAHYEQVVAEYNREKDRVTIEKTFDALIKLVLELDDEANRAVREGLDEETQAIFDLLRKDDLAAGDIKHIKAVSAELLGTLKAGKLRFDQWRDKEQTRDAVRLAIRDFLWSDRTGLPVDAYSEDEVVVKADKVFHHVFRAYPRLPSPIYVGKPSMLGLTPAPARYLS